jgi:hypothetical protein
MRISRSNSEIEEGRMPTLVVSESQFRANPGGILSAINATLDTNSPPSRISKWHNYYCTRVVIAMMVLTIFLFTFMDSQSVFLGLAYLVSGLLSLSIQSCFGMVSRLDKSCGDSCLQVKLVQLGYIVGFLLWFIVPYYLIGKHNAPLLKVKNNILTSQYVLLYFIGFIITSITMGFLIILPASIINEVIMLVKTLLCCNNTRSKESGHNIFRSIDLDPEHPRAAASLVELAGSSSRHKPVSREDSSSPARFERKDGDLSSPEEPASNPLRAYISKRDAASTASPERQNKGFSSLRSSSGDGSLSRDTSGSQQRRACL